MRKKVMIFLSVVMIMVACSRVPVTERKQLNLVPSGLMTQTSVEQYNQVLAQSNVVENTEAAADVNRVGSNIAAAVEQFLLQEGATEELDNFAWEFSLINEDVANAWAMPGGKVAVYTGILPITQNEAGLATVMGHEVAHVIAEHGEERMSQILLTELGGMTLNLALSNKPDQTRAYILQSYGLATQLGVLLPFSRTHESEADRLGLIFMAMAGYNPQRSVDFWERMRENAKGASPPEFLSTHPSYNTRIKNLKKHMPEAMEYYNKTISTQKD